MPTYEYVCEACEHRFEQFQPITAKPVRLCPECGRPKARRVITGGAGLIFKGSGFYITDYRSKGYRDAAKKESGDQVKAPACGPSSCKSPESCSP
jgi:putative FmdB family regulatory protein